MSAKYSRKEWLLVGASAFVLSFGSVEALRSWISSGNATAGWLAIALIACLAFLGTWDYRNRKTKEQGGGASSNTSSQ